jgi:FlaA1/EpsC-like NDP-sugar epimerase
MSVDRRAPSQVSLAWSARTAMLRRRAARLLLRHRRLVVVGVHLLLIPVGYLLALNLRFGFQIPAPLHDLVRTTLLLVLAVRMLCFAAFGQFHGWWRHTGVDDLTSIVKAVTLSSVLLAGALFTLGVLPSFPRAVLLLDWLVALFVVSGARFSVRMLREERITRLRSATGTRTLILGAGIAAEQLLRHIRYDPASEICPVGLLDDNVLKYGMRLHGVPVLGPTADLGRLAAEKQAELLVIAIPSADRSTIQQLVERCVATGIQFKIVPSLRELLDGETRIGQLRSVEIEDLLGREAVHLDLTQVEEDLSGKTVLITGAAGSIGSELARQVAAFGPARLVLLEQAESNLYFTHLELRGLHPHLDVVPVIADICDERRVGQVFALHRPDYVFHAAAYKHVPMMEANVPEAVKNNVLGTLCIAQKAVEHGVRKFVMISTDKAVNPSSVMGATKRIAERVVLGWPSLRASQTDFRAVRFGNVLGSDGSVIPLFKRQLASGAPLTVTHPEITRYFMTIPEAVQLVLEASALPEAAGCISMLDMGEPVKILDLAENLIRLSGLEPHREVPIVFTGLRPGEKLHEELMSEIESTVGTSVEKIRIVQTDEVDSNYLSAGIDRLAAGVLMGDAENLLRTVCDLVPEAVAPLRQWGRSAVRLPVQIAKVAATM